MSCWDQYDSRIAAGGRTPREAVLRREREYILRKMKSSLSLHSAVVDGAEQELAIIDSDNLNQKTVIALPGNDVRHGAVIEWMDNHWLVIEKDANTEVYAKGKMQQCNYLLRWVDNGSVIERWCIVEDGTKYLTGELEDRDYIVKRGDSRVSLILPMDEYTKRLNRKSRFLIDDYGDDSILAYRLTKPFKLGGSYNDNGVLAFVLVECNVESDDNLELHIADYYKYFPRVQPDGTRTSPDEPPTPGTLTESGRMWL